MPKRHVSTRRPVEDALKVTGQLIQGGRLQRKWPVSELAARAGVSERTVRAAEEGAPGTSFGTVLELLYLTGNSPFGVDDPVELARMRRRGEERLALLPSRARKRAVEVDDDF